MKPLEIAEKIVFMADHGEGTYPISKGAELIEQYVSEQAVEFSGWMWENHYDFWQFNGKEMDELYNQFKAEQP